MIKGPYSYFTDDTWLLVEEAERLNLITVKMFLKSGNDNNNEKSDELVEIMSKYYCISLKNFDSHLK